MSKPHPRRTYVLYEIDRAHRVYAYIGASHTPVRLTKPAAREFVKEADPDRLSITSERRATGRDVYLDYA